MLNYAKDLLIKFEYAHLFVTDEASSNLNPEGIKYDSIK